VDISSSSMAGVLATPAIDSNDNIYIGTDDGRGSWMWTNREN